MAELKEAELLNPPTVTVGTSPTPLFPAQPSQPVFWCTVLLRDIGTATFVRIGDNVNQNDTFSGEGDFRIYDAPPGFAFNAAKLHAISDSTDAVIEVQALAPAV